MAQTSELMERVIDVVGRNALHNADKVSETSVLKADHGIDSLKIVDLIMDLEDEFKITVDNNAIAFENFSTVENIVKYINSKM
jgi:acyl carrier protein